MIIGATIATTVSMGDWFARAFGSSVADIRHKLVEEAWFGREVTPRPLGGNGREPDERTMAERAGWTPPTHEHGIDR
jgi:hypothetical protein